MKNLKFSEMIRKNNELGESLKEKDKISIRVLANITVSQVKPILEFALRSEGLNASVAIGDFDNIIKESFQIENKSIPIIFWELCNTKDSFIFEIETLPEDQLLNYLKNIQSELSLLFDNFKTSGLVIFNTFSSFIYTHNNVKTNNIERITYILNDFIKKNAPHNFYLINLDKIFAALSINMAIDFRNFYNTKSLYTVDFFKTYATFILPLFLAAYSRTKKAVILDCDDTLWKGIVGEDGWENLAMSEKQKNGIYFKEVQYILKALSKNGIILGLCSKNNERDVDEVFLKNTDMILSQNDIVIKKVNWNDKVTNLIEIANELNIGIDSLVFIDDSAFEINLVNEKLPMVKTIQVPEKLFNYPKLLLDNLPLFFSFKTTNEDLLRVTMYKENVLRNIDKSQYKNMDDYLASLGIEMVIANKSIQSLERTVQLIQKTNQFNLTTKRYTAGEIQNFYNSDQYDVLSINVSDKYGNSGITGVCIIKYDENKTAEIDSLLLSCRVLGRNIEKAFLREIVRRISKKGYHRVQSSFKKTSKNSQGESFFETNGFQLLGFTESEKNYEVDCQKYLSENVQNDPIKAIWKTK